MAPRRGARNVKVGQIVDYDNLTVKEVLCPICRSILIEPVTLPCNHVFCSSCFQSTMENANLVCPLCRMRIGSWLRSSKKENKLVNMEYWDAIKRLFPEQIKNKLEGVEDNLDYEETSIQLAKPGELKEEYENQIQKETETFRKERQAEINASEALIKKLKEEEEYRKVVEEEKMRLDEEIARKLAEELNTVDEDKHTEATCSQANPSSNNNNSKKIGPLDRFLQNNSSKVSTQQSVPPTAAVEKKIDYDKKDYTCRILCHDVGNDWELESNTKTTNIGPPTLSMLNQQISLELQKVLDADYSDSNDSIEAECRYFKPIDYRRNLPCQKTMPIRVPAVKGEAEYENICAPHGQTVLQIDPLNSAFVEFGKLAVKEEELEDKRNKLNRQVTKQKNIGTEKNQTASSSKNFFKEISNKKKIDKTSPVESTTEKEQSTSQLEKMSSPMKRKLSTNSTNSDFQNKRTKMNLNDSNRRLLETPSSPFRGFCTTDVANSQPLMRFTRNICNRNQVFEPENNVDADDPDKIEMQVKSDFELAKKLQESFNSSYVTRSTAPRRGTKVTRQTTLDNMLRKQTKV